MKKLKTAIGIMSGTSLDGMDFSIIKSDGEKTINSNYNITYQYSQEFKNDIKKLIKNINSSDLERIEEIEGYKEIESGINKFVVSRMSDFLISSNIKIHEIDVIGFHGQTVIHQPNKKISHQIGCGDYLSKKLHVPFVTNFRNADILNGGQGAPLVPIFHKAIFSHPHSNSAIVNIGGIVNITWLKNKQLFLSTDLGPGNVLMDQFCIKHLNQPYDMDGAFALQGKVNFDLLKKWMNLHFINQSVPKSFDNYIFKIEDYLIENNNLSSFDILATFNKFCADIITDSKKFFSSTIDRWILCGGGAKNKCLLKNIQDNVENVLISNELGWDADFIESQAFAYLAIRKTKGLYSTFIETTGTKTPTICGELYEPKTMI